MLSRENEYWQQRNRFSIFLTQLRRHITPEQFRCLIRIQLAVDQMAFRKKLSQGFMKFWLSAVTEELDCLRRDLEKGTVPRSRLDRIVHLYGHVLS